LANCCELLVHVEVSLHIRWVSSKPLAIDKVRVHSVAAAYSYLETSPQIRLLTVAFKRRPSFAKALAELEDVNIYVYSYI